MHVYLASKAKQNKNYKIKVQTNYLLRAKQDITVKSSGTFVSITMQIHVHMFNKEVLILYILFSVCVSVRFVCLFTSKSGLSASTSGLLGSSTEHNTANHTDTNNSRLKVK